MAFDTVLPAAELRRMPHAPGAVAIVERFQRGQGIGLVVGAMAVGSAIGALLLVGPGRVQPEVQTFAILAAYAAAMVLMSLSVRDLVRARAPASVSLIAIHVIAVIASPFLILAFTSSSWQFWIGPSIALWALVSLFLLTPALASVVYRSAIHVCLLSTLASYLWVGLILRA
ncbi:MAG: hypothetical protein ABUS57_07405 [Pseudomonadota bacterium]